ncbi:large ribosomal subunit protein uL1m [Hyperolius riggenbachi]|uniref:large ribosomal subunit protein uL1m n=1 Tax=Hyperolius riggenbachi TaxID=752182 RepID=UPI0035A2E89C
MCRSRLSPLVTLLLWVMAASNVYCLLRTAIYGCQRHILQQMGFSTPSFVSANRRWTAVRFYAKPAVKKSAKNVQEKPNRVLLSKEELYERRKDRKPVDDVYLVRYYPKPNVEPEAAVKMLKTFQTLDFTCPNQDVYIQLTLDMKLEKKKKVEPFVGHLQLPFPFKKEQNRVLVFTEKAEEVEIAKINGAAFAGGTELIPEILKDEIQADFFIATPDIIANLNILKNKLRKKFPKSKRGSVGYDIANMLKLFQTCYEYIVEDNGLVRTKIATLDMPGEHIIANIDTLLKDVCEHKPLEFGPFVKQAILASATSEALYINFQSFLPAEPIKNEEEESLTE